VLQHGQCVIDQRCHRLFTDDANNSTHYLFLGPVRARLACMLAH
jgi:hypothetical protein